MSRTRRSAPLLAILVAILVPFLARDLFKPGKRAQPPPSDRTRAAAASLPAGTAPAHDAGGAAGSVDRAAVGIDEEHLFAGQVNRRGKPVGFHARPGGRDPRTARLVAIVDAPNAAGVYTAEVEIHDPRSGRWLRKTSTFYPDRMRHDEVLNAVLNAYQHAETGGEKFRGPSGTGFTIEGYFQNGRINTAYPIYSRR